MNVRNCANHCETAKKHNDDELKEYFGEDSCIEMATQDNLWVTCSMPGALVNLNCDQEDNSSAYIRHSSDTHKQLVWRLVMSARRTMSMKTLSRSSKERTSEKSERAL